MNLNKLCEAPNVTIYFDSWNNWLYLDWYGELTLPVVRYACLEIGRCYLGHSYPRVLNSNTQVTHIDWQVPAWLAHEFLPILELAGVEQMAWVYGPTLRGRDMAHETLRRLPALGVALFDDIEDAVAWLQQTHPDYASGCALLPRPLAASAKLTELVNAFARRLAAEQVPDGQPA